MIHIISGPSCAGKSTLLDDSKINSKTNFSLNKPVLYPKDIEYSSDAIQDNCFIHYNILRPADNSNNYFNNREQQMLDFMSDAPWAKISKSPQPKKAIILIVSRSILEKRMLSRQYVEPKSLTGFSPEYYPAKRWLQLLGAVDLKELYNVWFAELKHHGIDYTVINGENSNYEIIQKKDVKNLNLN